MGRARCCCPIAVTGGGVGRNGQGQSRRQGRNSQKE